MELNNLHAAIMNLPCKPPALAKSAEVHAYQYGHRDARHAAAELALAHDAEVTRLRDALREIALAGMSGTGQESQESMTAWHARQAWNFIGIAARALSAEVA